MIQIRAYVAADAEALWDLFFHTVRTINIRDYTPEQVAAWASDSIDLALWKEKMDAIQPFIAEQDGIIVGYTDLQPDGLVDHFFCHHAYQGCGVGRAFIRMLALPLGLFMSILVFQWCSNKSTVGAGQC